MLKVWALPLRCAAGGTRSNVAILHSHAARLQAAPVKTAGNAALCPPARMAALTAEGFLAAALVGAFLRMTTWSQS